MSGYCRKPWWVRARKARHPAARQVSADAKQPAARLCKRSVTIAGHRTSVSLEQAFWDALKEIAAADGLSMNALVAGIDADRSGNLSSGLRVFVLQRLREQRPGGQGPGDSTGLSGD